MTHDLNRTASAARADFLRLAGQLNSGDQNGVDAVLAGLSARPAGYALALVEAGLREYLTALHAVVGDPAGVQMMLDTAGMAALDRLRALG
ncbi:hypothetical protein A5649_02685 [Mycolicibacter heraklionensis]|uniref:Uncharacterized protein n=1 Tax=Mycolicibacter heraklionensis TaxID=512402 RepID=A0AA91EUQ0_9MYCO|nr:hypothetical protein [Mycolicibacter heraklionensis]OBK85269.1 hypothetical protein A5649_02685 [Mycolicibacter heraklionensis]